MQRKSFVIISILTFLFSVTYVHADFLDIRIFSEYSVDTLTIETQVGKYGVYADGKQIANLYKGNTVNVAINTKNNKVVVYEQGKRIGQYSQLLVKGESLLNVLTVNTHLSLVTPRTYDDDLKISVDNATKKLFLLNNVELEKYVAGVVQSEIFGSSKDIEFFKVQSVIARTYVLTNLMKHQKENFNVCDGVHCQAYRGRCTDDGITRATFETFRDVVVDREGRMISAAYHSNSGGQTVASEDVWRLETSYLKSVKDTFSIGAKNYEWTTQIPKEDWIKYFTSRYPEYFISRENIKNVLLFEQQQRKRYIYKDIPLKDVRIAFNLRSTFFSVREEGDFVVLRGRGYGHGVGLSQEGAIEMVKRGYKLKDIIPFYYKGCKVVKYTEVVH